MMMMLMMMMMMCKRLAQVPMLCVPIYNMKLTMMQTKTPIFTTFSAHTKMAADKRGQIEVFARMFTRGYPEWSSRHGSAWLSIFQCFSAPWFWGAISVETSVWLEKKWWFLRIYASRMGITQQQTWWLGTIVEIGIQTSELIEHGICSQQEWGYMGPSHIEIWLYTVYVVYIKVISASTRG